MPRQSVRLEDIFSLENVSAVLAIDDEPHVELRKNNNKETSLVVNSTSVEDEAGPSRSCLKSITINEDFADIAAGDRTTGSPMSGGAGFVRSSSVDGNIRMAFSRSQGNVRRWSQTLKLKNGRQTIREKTINFMPSRTQPDGVTGDEADVTEVDRLTKEIEQHDHLMDVTAQSEQNRIDTLRSLPKPIAVKREIRAKLSTSVTNKSAQQPIGSVKRMIYALGMWMNRTERSTTNTLINMELWYARLKRIEGHFGSAVGTYFKFLRSMIMLNGLMAVVSFCFIVIPQMIFNANAEPPSSNLTRPAFDFADLFTAQGFMADSILFYGAYTNESLRINSRSSYSLPNAYFMTLSILYIITFVTIAVSVARSYRRSFIETAGSMPNLYAQKLFSSWDFSITSCKAAHLKHSQIYHELREVLHDIQANPEEVGRYQMIVRRLTQVMAHLVVLSMLAGIGWSQWTLLRMIEDQHVERSTWPAMYVALMVNGTLVVMEVVFVWMARMENYRSGRTRLHITLFRIYALEVVLIGVLVVFWLTKKYLNPCWESAVGHEIYRLIVVDFVVVVLGSLLLHALRWAVHRWVWPGVGLPEFDIIRGSLGLVFNQSLMWVGLLFAPMLATIVVVKMLITFYLKEATLMYFCKPSTKLWRSAQTSTLFLVMVFVSLLSIVTTHGYIVSEIQVSTVCGPFRNNEFMIKLFIDGILNLTEQHTFWTVFLTVTKPAFIGGVLLCMTAVTYYLRAKSKAHIGMVKILKEMLKMEAVDKEFLLAEISRMTHGKDEYFNATPLAQRKRSRVETHTADAYIPSDEVRINCLPLPTELNGKVDVHADGEPSTKLRSRNA